MTTAAEPIVGTFVADPAHSTFRFALRYMNVGSFSATFDDVEVRVTAGPGGVTLDGVVRVESISIKSPKEFRDHVVYSDEFFDATNHPELKFHSSDIKLAEDGTATVAGELTIKGITKGFVATGTYGRPVEDPFGSTHAAVELATRVDRRNWGLNWQAPMPKGGELLAWEVALTADVLLRREG